MSYTSNELASLSGYSLSRISFLLKSMGFSPTDVANNNQYVWDESCLDALLERKNEIKIEKASNIGTLAQKFNVSNCVIREVLTAMGIEPLYYSQNKQVEFYDKKVVAILKEYFDTDKKDDEEEHPLVTEKAFLRTSYFPDVKICYGDD